MFICVAMVTTNPSALNLTVCGPMRPDASFLMPPCGHAAGDECSAALRNLTFELNTEGVLCGSDTECLLTTCLKMNCRAVECMSPTYITL